MKRRRGDYKVVLDDIYGARNAATNLLNLVSVVRCVHQNQKIGDGCTDELRFVFVKRITRLLRFLQGSYGVYREQHAGTNFKQSHRAYFW